MTSVLVSAETQLDVQFVLGSTVTSDDLIVLAFDGDQWLRRRSNTANEAIVLLLDDGTEEILSPTPAISFASPEETLLETVSIQQFCTSRSCASGGTFTLRIKGFRNLEEARPLTTTLKVDIYLSTDSTVRVSEGTQVFTTEELLQPNQMTDISVVRSTDTLNKESEFTFTFSTPIAVPAGSLLYVALPKN